MNSPRASGVQPELTVTLFSPQGPRGYKGMVGSIGAAGSPVSVLLLLHTYLLQAGAPGAAKGVGPPLSPCDLDACLSLPG